MDISDHLIDNLMEWERKFESADFDSRKTKNSNENNSS